jgi:hypothetical protein
MDTRVCKFMREPAFDYKVKPRFASLTTRSLTHSRLRGREGAGWDRGTMRFDPIRSAGANGPMVELP